MLIIKTIINSINLPAPDLLCYDIFYLRKNNQKNCVSNFNYYKAMLNFYLLKYKSLIKKTILKLRKSNQLSKHKSNYSIQSPIVVVLGTLNHTRVFDCFKDYIKYPYVIWGNKGDKSKRNLPNLPINSSVSLLDEIKLITFLLFNEITPKQNKENFHEQREFVYKTYVQLLQVEKLLKESQVKLIILFNDHVSWYRAVLFAAKRLNIKTAYIPHASVTEEFPPLIFDYAFLEGSDMANKYLCKLGNTSKIALIGNCKFDTNQKESIEHSRSGITIGIGYNLLDNIESVKQITSALAKKYDNNEKDFIIKSLIIRPHPQTKNEDIINLEHPIVTLSNPQEENSLQFLDKCDLIISTPSTNLVLESLLMNTPVIPFDFFDKNNISKKYDQYNFVKNNLLEPPLKSESCLFNKIKEIRDNNFTINQTIKNKLKSYNAAIGTPYEKAVSPLIGKAINDMVSQGNLSEDLFK